MYHPVGQKIARNRSICYGFRDIDTFSFSAKNVRWPPKVAKIEIFPPLTRRLLYHPAGQKFAQNRSISYGFRDIDTFLFSAKIQKGRQKWRKLIFYPFAQDILVLPCRSKKNSLEIALSLMVFEIFTLFHFFPLKSKKAAKSGEN